MSAALTTPRRGMQERDKRTARRARFAVGGDAARGSGVICSMCNGVVEDRTYVRVVCSCCLHLRCALGFMEDSAHGRTGPTTITCPNPASHSGRQHITLGPLVVQIRITLNATSLADTVIMTGRVLQAQRLFLEATTAQEVVDLTRVTTMRGETDADEDGRGAYAPQQNIRMPCRVCGENMERRDRFGFSRWAVYPRCALNTAEGASDAGEDRFGIEVGKPKSPGGAKFTWWTSYRGST